MNTRNLQIHLENRLSDLASACINQGVQDDGLIVEILANDTLSDENRLRYICQIEIRLPKNERVRFEGEESLNERYQEGDEARQNRQRQWNRLHDMAVSLRDQQAEREQAHRERILQLVSILTI